MRDPQTTLTTRFWRWLLRDPKIRHVVKVKSLWPSWDDYHGALAWPTLLVDRMSERSTITAIWTKARYAFWRKHD